MSKQDNIDLYNKAICGFTSPNGDLWHRVEGDVYVNPNGEIGRFKTLEIGGGFMVMNLKSNLLGRTFDVPLYRL